MASSSSITIVIPHFGPWPIWGPFFLASCAFNRTINWLLVGDQLPREVPDNVTCRFTTFADYVAHIDATLGIRCRLKSPYKLCDVRPALGVIHADELRGADWWGFGDHDVIYGDVRKFLPESLLKRYWLLSCHGTQISGHLTFIRNIEPANLAFRQASRWRVEFEQPEFSGFDEHAFTTRTYGYKRLPQFARQIQRWLDPVKRHSKFIERHSTILAGRPWWDGSVSHPTEWRWRNGQLTNTRDGDREFMYLHFMNFKSSRYLPAGHGPAAWEGRVDIVRVDPALAVEEGFCITPKGFESLSS